VIDGNRADCATVAGARCGVDGRMQMRAVSVAAGKNTRCGRASRTAAVVLALAMAMAHAAGDGVDGSKAGSAVAEFPRGLIELKRQGTARGTPEETTKTNLEFDHFPPGGAVSLLRLELPFPDAKTSFSGSVLDPDFGDAKIRIGFRAVEVSTRPVTSFVELTFPTADPQSQGTGKYQASAGARTAFPLSPGTASFGSPRQALSAQVQQVVSFAGDPATKDINQTKFELEWRGTWTAGHHAKATAKPVVDWVGDGRTGAVLELEAGWLLDRQWTLALMAGGLLWGEGVPSTYSKRAEIKLVYRY
jgi:hypothetical protein